MSAALSRCLLCSFIQTWVSISSASLIVRLFLNENENGWRQLSGVYVCVGPVFLKAGTCVSVWAHVLSCGPAGGK